MIKKMHFATLPSTNTWAKEHLLELDRDALTVITADEQTAGRGRFKRSWISPKGCNLYATYVFFIDAIDESVRHISQVLALSAYKILQPWVPHVKLKWPNDLVIDQKKLGGILCELSEAPPHWAVITGIGININMPKSILETIDRPATSLMEECGLALERSKIEEALNAQFQSDLQELKQRGFLPFLNTFKEALIHRPNETLRFHDFQKEIRGTFQGINADGSLNLQLPDGTIKRCMSGEIIT